MISPLLADSPIHEQDVRDIVRLLGEVIAGPEGITEKRRMLMDGLCRLIDARSWVWYLAEPRPDMAPSVIGFDHGGWDDGRFLRYIEAMNHPDMESITRPASAGEEETVSRFSRTRGKNASATQPGKSGALPLLEGAGVGAMLTSVRQMENGTTGGIGICREPDRPHFSEREARIAHIILSEIPWLHTDSFPEQEADGTTTLYPRHRSILELLCQGWSRKEIADHLGISVNTVHGYTRVIFKHFGVHSQAELIARFTKGDGGGSISYSI